MLSQYLTSPRLASPRLASPRLAELATGYVLQPRYHYGNESGIGPGLILDAPGTASLRGQANAPEGFITLCRIFPVCA